MKTPIDIEAAKALALDGKNLFICGRAGTGKSTLLRAIRKELEAADKQVVTLAPTGIAAYNVDGQTIHSFFRYPLGMLGKDDALTAAWNPNNLKIQVMKVMDTLIIDEVSMVRSDLCDAMDVTLRDVRRYVTDGAGKLPFGGVQVIFVGDIMQLPPVVKSDEGSELQRRFGGEYFFDAIRARGTGKDFYFIELTKVFRQNDPSLSEALNQIRIGSAESEVLDKINARVGKASEDALILTAHRRVADGINLQRLSALPRAPLGVWRAELEGRISAADVPVGLAIPISVGARVMMCINCQGSYVNGDLGEIVSASEDGVEVRLDSGETVFVTPHNFEKIDFRVSPGGRIERHTVGTLKQLPIQLAWAVTIHKSQGLTLDRLHIDLGDGAFASGQVYVGLSRATSWDSITIERPISESDIICDPRGRDFLDVMESGLREYNLWTATGEMARRIS